VYGPHLAQLYASSRVHDQIQSLGHFFKPTDTLDLKLNLASANYELTQSIPHVVEYFGPDPGTTWAQMAEHEERLQQILLEFLSSNSRIDVIGEVSASKELRVSVISFVVQGVGSQRLVEEVERRSAFGFRSGHMYSHRLLADVCGLEDVEDGVVRVSFLHYNTGEWVARLDSFDTNKDRGRSTGAGRGVARGACIVVDSLCTSCKITTWIYLPLYAMEIIFNFEDFLVSELSHITLLQTAYFATCPAVISNGYPNFREIQLEA
jgi:hypothetical protein